WEQAVERVLGARLAAVCADKLDELAGDLAALAGGRISVVDLTVAGTAVSHARPALLDKIQSPVDLAPLLGGVYTADTLEQALAQRVELGAHESFVTPAGVWIGRNWLSRDESAGSEYGWLAREREIEALERESSARREQLERLERELAQATAAIAEHERERDDLTRRLNAAQQQRAELRERLGHREAHLAQLEARVAQITREQEELRAQLEHDQTDAAAAAERLRAAAAETDAFEARRSALSANRQDLSERLNQARAAESEARERA